MKPFSRQSFSLSKAHEKVSYEEYDAAYSVAISTSDEEVRKALEDGSKPILIQK